MRNDQIVYKMIGIIEKLQDYVAGCNYDSFSENDMMFLIIVGKY